MRAIRSHEGIQHHHHTVVGINGRLDTIQAAVLLSKIPHSDNKLRARGSLGLRYLQLLGRHCMMPHVAPRNTHLYAQYTVRVSERDTVADKMEEHGIPTAVCYPKCLHEQPVYRSLNCTWGQFQKSGIASREVLSLPIRPFLAKGEQGHI
jgi:UDP-2-acetamido-2-deoxy-ribo-hexuluronate aminotransferase